MLLQRKYGYGQMNFHNKKNWNELQLNVIILDCDEDDCDDDDDDDEDDGCDDNDDVDGDTQCGVCVCVYGNDHDGCYVFVLCIIIMCIEQG